jgi:hypothetical protein
VGDISAASHLHIGLARGRPTFSRERVAGFRKTPRQSWAGNTFADAALRKVRAAARLRRPRRSGVAMTHTVTLTVSRQVPTTVPGP